MVLITKLFTCLNFKEKCVFLSGVWDDNITYLVLFNIISYIYKGNFSKTNQQIKRLGDRLNSNYDIVCLNYLQGVRELFKIQKVWKYHLTNFKVIMHNTRLPEGFFLFFKALTSVTIRLLQFKFQFHTVTTVPHFTYIYRNVYIL